MFRAMILGSAAALATVTAAQAAPFARVVANPAHANAPLIAAMQPAPKVESEFACWRLCRSQALPPRRTIESTVTRAGTAPARREIRARPNSRPA